MLFDDVEHASAASVGQRLKYLVHVAVINHVTKRLHKELEFVKRLVQPEEFTHNG
jgi:hypothetical protein